VRSDTTVYETDVPGVGRKFEYELDGEDRFVVFIHHDGKREVFRRPSADADGTKLFEFSDRQAREFGTLLEGAYFQPVDLDTVEVPLGEAIIEWIDLPEDSPVAGETLRDAEIPQARGRRRPRDAGHPRATAVPRRADRGVDGGDSPPRGGYRAHRARGRGRLAVRANQSVIPTYIVAGILVGPNVPTALGPVPLTLVANREFIDVLAELGIVFLLFFLGSEFNVDRLVEGWDRLVGIGTADFVVNFGAGVAPGYAFGFSPIETLFLAGIVYISSSAVITKSLIERGWIANPESEAVLGTLVFEDILIAVYLAVLSAVALGGGGLGEAAATVGIAFGFLGALTVIAEVGALLAAAVAVTP